MDLATRILYEDNHLIIINKMAGEIVQGDKTGDKPLIDDVKSYLKTRYHKEGNVFCGLVHRIDRPVSGAVVFAKTSKALSRMTVKVKDRDFRKTYLALVKNEKQNKSYVVPEGTKEAKLARLSYRVVGKSETFYLLEVELFTGRHHQIRCQLAHIGCPIRGDLKYGYPRSNPDASISLHAWRIAFEHPVLKTQIEIKAPLPEVAPWTAFQQLSD